jgi:hypothetical protein
VSSIWNRIGDVASTVAKDATKFGGQVLGSAKGVAQFAWDVGTAPWNDADAYNGFSNTIKSAASKNQENIVAPYASAGGAIMKVPGLQPTLERINNINQQYIREPLTTFALVQGDVDQGRASFFDPNEWKKAYEGAQTISFGQAVVGDLRSYYDPKFNIYDPRQREAAFKKSAWGKVASGGADLGIQFFGDITLAGGKIAKGLKATEYATGALKNADAVAKAAEDITKAQYGVNNRFTKVIDDFTKNDSVYALNHPMVKSSSQPGLLAHLLGQSTDKTETAQILRSALGDPAAMDELRLKRADITDALEAARADLSTVDEYKLFAAPDGTGMIPFLNDTPAVIESAKANYAALAQQDQYFAKLMQIGEGGGTLTRTTGKLAQKAEDFVAQSRALKFYDKAVGTPSVEVFQPTPFHRLYQKISWAAGERPAGLVDFNDPDSYKEVVATINQLEKLVNLTPEQSRSMLDSYIKAATPEERYAATMTMEGAALRTIMAKHGITDEKLAENLYNNYVGARTSALRSVKDKGFMVDYDGSILKVPQLESQSADYLPIMDFPLMDKLLKQNKTALNALGGRAVDTTLHYVDILQDAFKAGALLRLGYTQRNAIDSQLRIAASVGAMTTLRHLGPGLKNILNNSVAVPARLIDRYLPVDSNMTIREVQQSHTSVIRELTDLKSQIAETEAKLSLNPNDADLAGKLNTEKLLQEEKQAVYKHYSDVLNRHKGKTEKQRIGTGSFEVTTSDGKKYVLHDAFGGPLGEMFRKIASSGNSFERMVDSNTDMYSRMLTSKGIQQIRPTDPAYFDQWAQTLRQQFGNSRVVNKIISGEPIEDTIKWLRNSPEGRDLRRRLSIPSSEADEYVTKINGFLDQYLPETSGLRSKIKDITAADLRSAFTDPTELPVIHGHLLEESLFNTSQIKGREIINTLFHFLGTLPEDTWARNPLYVQLYRKEAERRVNIMADLKGESFSQADQEAIMGVAHKVAQRQMKEILFNIERRSNLAAAMKYISPFFSAQENAYKTWTKLAIANPQIVNRGYMVWQAPNKAGLVTDQDGKIVPPGQTSGSDVIWVGVPKGIQKLPGLGSLTQMGIPKQSLDIIFQGGMDVLYNKGNPNVFSDIFPIGPYIGVPVSEIVKNQPNLEDAFKWALPYGPSKDAISGFLPSWVQKQQVKQAGLNDPQFARSYQLIWNTEQMKAKRNGEPPVKAGKILDMTKDYWNMRTAANLLMPFAPRFDSPYKYYLDKSREYKRVYGLEADAKFLQDYPDFFEFSASLSSNPTSVQYSVNAVQNVKKYGSLISELVNVDPKLIGLVVNDPKGYEFSQASYDYLYNKRISPDAPTKFLSSQSPAEAQRKNEANKGWIQYNKLSTILDAELKNRGLTSVQQKGAEDLKAVKEAVVSKLSVQTDSEGKPVFDKKTGQYVQTAWYDDYLDSDGSKTNKVIVGLGKIMDSKFIDDHKNNPMWKSVSTYLDVRQAFAKELEQRQAKSIDAKSNTDLRYAYDAVVAKLKKDDPIGFSYLYDRFLSQDLIVDKYLTPVVTKKGTK